MSMRKWFGIDGMELTIHVALTICVIGLLINSPGVQEETVFFGVAGLSILVLAIRRHFARRRGRLGTDTDALEAPEQRVYELEQRVAELETTQFRVTELEERLDFAERLLAQRQDQDPRQLR